MREFLAVDAGGTSSRAVVVDESGRCLGYGRAAGGNPVSVGLDAAAVGVADALTRALAATGPGPTAEPILLANAGGGGEPFQAAILQRLEPLGVRGPFVPVGDLLALFCSGTPELDGAALIAGTGAIGGAIRDGRMARVVDGTGWLLGDAGSGYWMGHKAARAVVDHLDGGPATHLTDAVLARLGIADDRVIIDGRPRVMSPLIAALYALRPVELARFAPLVFDLAGEDETAASIVRDAVEAQAALLRRVRRFQADGPLVFGGSVLVEGSLRLDQELLAPLLDAADGATPIPVSDGLVGAAVLALRHVEIEVGAELFARVRASVRAATVAG
ncbi:MAG TPA: BadF/BadG/BcrA/BcrD ATPase family protein [Amnibacterium sp.]|nr:BadF/BadG/BcrA/BcrD ATPase family protein [Amnibacterium sp.]